MSAEAQDLLNAIARMVFKGKKPTEIEAFVDEQIDKLRGGGIKCGERFYIIDHNSKTLFATHAYDRYEALEILVSDVEDIPGVSKLTPQEVMEYTNEGWSVE